MEVLPERVRKYENPEIIEAIDNYLKTRQMQ